MNHTDPPVRREICQRQDAFSIPVVPPQEQFYRFCAKFTKK